MSYLVVVSNIFHLNFTIDFPSEIKSPANVSMIPSIAIPVIFSCNKMADETTAIIGTI